MQPTAGLQLRGRGCDGLGAEEGGRVVPGPARHHQHADKPFLQRRLQKLLLLGPEPVLVLGPEQRHGQSSPGLVRNRNRQQHLSVLAEQQRVGVVHPSGLRLPECGELRGAVPGGCVLEVAEQVQVHKEREEAGRVLFVRGRADRGSPGHDRSGWPLQLVLLLHQRGQQAVRLRPLHPHRLPSSQLEAIPGQAAL